MTSALVTFHYNNQGSVSVILKSKNEMRLKSISIFLQALQK